MRENLSSDNYIIYNEGTGHDVLTLSTSDVASFYSSVGIGFTSPTASLSVNGNTTSGNILTGGLISATGNIKTAGYFIGTFSGNFIIHL
jgi:hypothetical protein